MHADNAGFYKILIAPANSVSRGGRWTDTFTRYLTPQIDPRFLNSRTWG